jgi:hypothetical protein
VAVQVESSLTVVKVIGREGSEAMNASLVSLGIFVSPLGKERSHCHKKLRI